MFPKIISIIALSFSSIVSIVAQLSEGNSCRLENGSNGKCTVIMSCPSIYQEFRSGKYPTNFCGWSGFDPIVCCPSSSHTLLSKVTAKPTTTSTTTRPRTTRRRTTTEISFSFESTEDSSHRDKSISRIKCEEYSRLAFALELPPTLTIHKKPVNASKCAFQHKKLIVGGKKADPKEFPHMAAVGFMLESGDIGWFCGGTIISEKYVLTAAHCLYSIDYEDPKWVRVGDLNLRLNNEDAKPANYRILDTIYHPGYKKPSEYHDIGLLLVDGRIEFNAWVRPACLPSFEQVKNVQRAIATGWGHVEWDGEGSDDLLKVTLPIVHYDSCKSSYPDGGIEYKMTDGVIDNQQICAGSDMKDTCQGDSGGPLATYDNEFDCIYDVIGVTSLGSVCGSNTPGIYTRVYHYRSWIESIVWPSSY